MDLLPPDRAAFGLPRDVVWLNAAQMSILHERVEAAGQRGVSAKRRPWELPPQRFFSEIETARERFATLIGAETDGVALIPSASYGFAAAAANLPLSRGDEIVLIEEQFPSNVYVWTRRAAETGARIVWVKRAGDGGLTDPLIDALSPKTAILAAGLVHWSDGTAIDWPTVAARARAVGAALALDGTQLIGAAPFDLAAVDPDFLVCPTYKWLLGPYSAGFLYVAPRWRRGRPLEETWMNRANAERFSELVRYCEDYAPGARRFDMGEKAQFHTAPMSLAAVTLLLEWGVARLARSLAAVNGRLIEGLAARGFTPPPPHARAPHFFGVGLPAHAPPDLAQRLSADRVYVSIRGAKMRISPHLWIDGDDEARFFEALDPHLSA